VVLGSVKNGVKLRRVWRAKPWGSVMVYCNFTAPNTVPITAAEPK